jgi:solute carrier family 35 protein F5
VWTLAFSVVALRERVGLMKGVAVAITLVGASLTTLNSNSAEGRAEGDTWWGVMLALVSAVAYGAYTVQIRRAADEDASLSMPTLFGMIGVINFVAMAPIVGVLSGTGVEPLAKLTMAVLGLVVIKGLLDNVLSDLLWASAIVLTSPTVATIGLSLTIPLSMLGDWALLGHPPSLLLVLGAVLTILGFVAIELSSAKEGKTGVDEHSKGELGEEASLVRSSSAVDERLDQELVDDEEDRV